MKKEAGSRKPEARITSRKIPVFILASGFWLLASFYAQAEIIDRIVAVVEGRIITLTDLRQEREIRARLGDEAVDDDKVLVQQMIEDHLIEIQISSFPGIEVTEAEIDASLDKSKHLSPAIREAVRRRLRRLRYFDVTFRRNLRASDEEVRKYYDEVFVPEAGARGVNPIPKLEEVADAVRQNVVEESLSREVDNWLEAIRRRSSIEIFE